METLPLSIRKEQFYHEFVMGGVVSVGGKASDTKKSINLKKRVTPIC